MDTLNNTEMVSIIREVKVLNHENIPFSLSETEKFSRVLLKRKCFRSLSLSKSTLK